MDFDESVRYMQGLIRFGWKLGNQRFEALCERMGSPQRQVPVIHVAGTKGKGSTTALTAGILRAQGHRVGAYYSPYVYDVRERVQVDGAMIPREDFARLVTTALPHIEAIAATQLGQTTEFELKTLLGFLWFAEQKVDYACIEVGIGGRLDATNVVCPLVTVITNIGLDHTRILGDTHELIAAEKAGIIKPGVPCVTAVQHPDARETILGIAQGRNAPVVFPGWACAGHFDPVTISSPLREYGPYPMRMGGLVQRANAACALAAAELALARSGSGALRAAAVADALATVALPGRLSTLKLDDGPLVVMDGAHNGLAAEALAGPLALLRASAGCERLLLVVGMVGGHDPAEVLRPLAPDADKVFACAPDWKRALPAEEIAAAARRFCSDVETAGPVASALRAALSAAGPRDMVVITGSFYTVGEAPPERIAAEWSRLKR